MNLREYQRAFLRIGFAEAAPAADLAAMGDEKALLLYRHMLRTRLAGMAKVAFKECCARVGDAAFEASFARFLAARPPHSPLIRDAIADFGPFAREDRVLIAAGPAFLRDLLAFEEHKWRLAYVAAHAPRLGEDGVRELDFEGRPVWNPALRILPLRHAVHSDSVAPAEVSATLLMYRPPHVDEVRWYLGDPFFCALLGRSLAEPGEALAELVQRVAAAREVALDQPLLESLATALTLALERGVLLGVR